MATLLFRVATSTFVTLLAIGSMSVARAQDYGDPSGKALIATADLRGVLADGERSWIDGGFGKSRFGGDADPAFRLAEANIVWSPEITWSLSAVIAVTAQNRQDKAVDLSEGYASWKRGPHGSFRFSGRAGIYWPPVSLEHSGPEWAVTDTITPSAINSWIGEEVKVAGAEATGSWGLGRSGRLYLTAGLFGLNDTAGTLLAFRGWALHDEKASVFSEQALPPLDGLMRYAQAPRTRPMIELDNRPGFYGRIGWTPSSRLKLHAFYYDNRSDPTAVNPELQWGWRTRFVEAGGAFDSGTTRIVAQAMQGSTQMGFPRAGRIWVDTDFRSAFALVTRRLGRTVLSGRIEAFGTDGRGSVLGADESETGWAGTLAAKRSLGDHATLLGEVLHIDSTRAARARDGLTPRQQQTIVQVALRLRS